MLTSEKGHVRPVSCMRSPMICEMVSITRAICTVLFPSGAYKRESPSRHLSRAGKYTACGDGAISSSASHQKQYAIQISDAKRSKTRWLWWNTMLFCQWNNNYRPSTWSLLATALGRVLRTRIGMTLRISIPFQSLLFNFTHITLESNSSRKPS